MVKRSELHTFVVLPEAIGGRAVLCLAAKVPPTLEELRKKTQHQSANGGACLRGANSKEIVNRLLDARSGATISYTPLTHFGDVSWATCLASGNGDFQF